jgi:hypothetical protein
VHRAEPAELITLWQLDDANFLSAFRPANLGVMTPDTTQQCRRWFLSELEAGALPGMAAVFAGIRDPRIVLQWYAKDPEFAAEWDRAIAEVSRHAVLAERSKCPAAIIEWLRTRGGKADVTMRALGADLGCSAPKIHRVIRELAAVGVLRASFSSRGTTLELVTLPS